MHELIERWRAIQTKDEHGYADGPDHRAVACADELEAALAQMRPVAYWYKSPFSPNHSTDTLSFHVRKDLLESGWIEFPLHTLGSQVPEHEGKA